MFTKEEEGKEKETLHRHNWQLDLNLNWKLILRSDLDFKDLRILFIFFDLPESKLLQDQFYIIYT